MFDVVLDLAIVLLLTCLRFFCLAIIWRWAHFLGRWARVRPSPLRVGRIILLLSLSLCRSRC